MSTIHFEAQLLKINSWTILLLPKDVSAKLPSRGMTMVEGTINNFGFKTVLEPDGKGSHWFRIDETLQKGAHAKAGVDAKLSINTTSEWIEPEIPVDLKRALASSPRAYDLWKDTTPNAHWDWVRWIRAVKTPETRQKHVEVAISKLNKGMKRPCCFNRNLCSEPYVSHNWVLLDPTQTIAKSMKPIER